MISEFRSFSQVGSITGGIGEGIVADLRLSRKASLAAQAAIDSERTSVGVRLARRTRRGADAEAAARGERSRPPCAWLRRGALDEGGNSEKSGERARQSLTSVTCRPLDSLT